MIRSVDPAWYIGGWGGGLFVVGIKVSYANKITSLVRKGN